MWSKKSWIIDDVAKPPHVVTIAIFQIVSIGIKHMQSFVLFDLVLFIFSFFGIWLVGSLVVWIVFEGKKEVCGIPRARKKHKTQTERERVTWTNKREQPLEWRPQKNVHNWRIIIMATVEACGYLLPHELVIVDSIVFIVIDFSVSRAIAYPSSRCRNFLVESRPISRLLHA